MGGRRQHPLLIEGLLIGADAFVQGLFLILLETTVGDVEHTLAEKADRLIIELKVRAEQPQRCSLINKPRTSASIFLELPVSTLRETSSPNVEARASN